STRSVTRECVRSKWESVSVSRTNIHCPPGASITEVVGGGGATFGDWSAAPPVGFLDDLLQIGVILVLTGQFQDGGLPRVPGRRSGRKPLLDGSLEESPLARGVPTR